MSFVRFGTAIRTPLPVPQSMWFGTEHWLEAWNGDKFDLTDFSGRSGVFITRDGLRGMGMPPLARWTTESPATPGEVWRGHRVKARDVLLPLHIYCETGTNDYIDWEERLFDALEPTHTFQWHVRTKRSHRVLTCRFRDDSDHQETFDTPLRGWDNYAISAVAEDPFWYAADPVTETWTNDAGRPFFGGVEGGYGPPFHLTTGKRMGAAVIRNRGKVAAWPTWRISGPATTATISVDGVSIDMRHTIAEGDWVTIDTQPSHRGLFDSTGTFVPGGLARAQFGSVPPGAEVPIGIVVDSAAATVSCSLTERFYRARG